MIICRKTDTPEDIDRLVSVLKAEIKDRLASGQDIHCKVANYIPKRSLEQNDKMWTLIHHFSNTLQVVVNGERRLISPEDMKDYMTAQFLLDRALETNTAPKFAQTKTGHFILLGSRTSRFTMKLMAEFIEFLEYMKAEHDAERDPE
jgi:hypothetical protein